MSCFLRFQEKHDICRFFDSCLIKVKSSQVCNCDSEAKSGCIEYRKKLHVHVEVQKPLHLHSPWRVLLFPIVIPIFFVGYAMMVVGRNHK